MASAEKLIMLLGSGFSVDFGLPVTSKLQEKLLEVTANDPREAQREEFISRTIASFWKDIFGWAESLEPPSLEDHFTQIDMAANSGHYLGRLYGPKKLRALRRMTIHRVFKLLDVEPKPAQHIDALLQQLRSAFELSIVTTNWDIMAERCLERAGAAFIYSRQRDSRNPTRRATGIPIWKLHGSGNWGYCDLCRSLITSDIALGKAAVHFGWLLEADDFELFGGGHEVGSNLDTQFRDCLSCGGRVAVRVATFSYRKHLDVPFFQSIWDEARDSLHRADRWLFVGYSMPEADVEIRHLLKTSELAHPDSAKPRIDVVLKGDVAATLRYQRLFGRSIASIDNGGIEQWVGKALPYYHP